MIITGFMKFKRHNVCSFTVDVWVSRGMILRALIAFLASKNELSHSIDWCNHIPELPAETVVFIFSLKENDDFVIQL